MVFNKKKPTPLKSTAEAVAPPPVVLVAVHDYRIACFHNIEGLVLYEFRLITLTY